MSTNDSAVEIATDALGMAVALMDKAGAKMDAGFAKIELDGAPANAVPLQVCKNEPK